MTKLIENFILAKELILNPADFFQSLKVNKINWTFPLGIYLIYMILNSIFLNYRPLDFPNEMAALNIVNPSFLFYFGIQFLWGTLFSLVFIVSVLLLIRFYAFNFPIAFFSCLFSVIAGTYILKTSDSFLLQSILLSIFISASIFLIRKNTNNFLFLVKATFSINTVLLLFLPMLFLSVFINSENLFLIGEIIIFIWLLILFVKMVKTISEMSVLKTMVIFGFSATGTFGLFYLLVKTNLLSDNTFQALLSI